jgi:hypothetical protein
MGNQGNSGGSDGDLNDFAKQMEDDFASVDSATGAYAGAVQELATLSAQANAAGTIASVDEVSYAQLLALVQTASASNLSQAELKNRIIGLGQAAVGIAERIKGLASIF